MNKKSVERKQDHKKNFTLNIKLRYLLQQYLSQEKFSLCVYDVFLFGCKITAQAAVYDSKTAFKNLDPILLYTLM